MADPGLILSISHGPLSTISSDSLCAELEIIPKKCWVCAP